MSKSAANPNRVSLSTGSKRELPSLEILVGDTPPFPCCVLVFTSNEQECCCCCCCQESEPEESIATSAMSSIAAAYAIGNVASSVAIVLVNKQVFKGGFHFPMTLSFFVRVTQRLNAAAHVSLTIIPYTSYDHRPPRFLRSTSCSPSFGSSSSASPEHTRPRRPGPFRSGRSSRSPRRCSRQSAS